MSDLKTLRTYLGIPHYHAQGVCRVNGYGDDIHTYLTKLEEYTLALEATLKIVTKPVVIKQLPKRVDEMNETEFAIYEVAAEAIGNLMFVQKQAREAING